MATYEMLVENDLLSPAKTLCGLASHPECDGQTISVFDLSSNRHPTLRVLRDYTDKACRRVRSRRAPFASRCAIRISNRYPGKPSIA